jgi:hypothetical protein
MRRSSRLLTPILSLLIPFFYCSAQAAPQSPVDVAYVVSSSGIETYNVDLQTGQPTDLGLTVVVPPNPTVVPSANGQFLYVFGTDPGTGAQQLWVYATNSMGVPQSTPIQQLDFADTYSFNIDPNETIAYGAETKLNSQGETLAAIRLFTIDPATGLVTESPKAAAKYPTNGPCKSILDSVSFGIGFHSSETKLYDGWSCDFHESGTVSFYTRSVNQNTGALGPDVEIFAWGISTGGGYDVVDFTPRLLIDFHVPNDYQQGVSSVNVYPPTGGNSPLFSCDASMLEACGYGTSINVDPLGNNIFIRIASDTAEITKLEVAAKKIVATAYYVPPVIAFSPDDKLVYTQNYGLSNPYVLPIYTFDPATGAVTTTQYAQIYVQQTSFTLVPAIRK